MNRKKMKINEDEGEECKPSGEKRRADETERKVTATELNSKARFPL